ncbi:MAG: TonB-dependent receptor [Mucinivorans sp.]
MKNTLLCLIVTLLWGLAPAFAQQATVTGMVTDLQNQPIIGATVVLSGTNSGVSTDIDGKFSIKANVGQDLTVKFLGYVPVTLRVENGRHYNVQMKEDAVALEKVVVIGFGTQKKVNLTNAVSTVDKEYLQTRPVTNLGQALQGTVPGLNISATGGGGRLGQGMDINIRGIGTIGNSSSAPLVLIDGVAGDINQLNPDDVADISILKDGGSAAIYGSRAAFGVILITTKSGKAGKTNITYTNNFRFTTPIRMPHQADSYSYALYLNEIKRNMGSPDFFTEEVLGLIQDNMAGKIEASNRPNPGNKNMWARNNNCYGNVDYYKENYKDWAFQHEHNLAVSGGSDKTQYYVSLNYLNQEGMMRYGDETNSRYSFNTKVTSKLTKWLDMTASAKFIRNDIDEPTFLADGRLSGQFFDGMTRVMPTNPIQNPDGSYTWPNFISRIKDGGRVKNQRDLIYMSLSATARLMKGWTLNADINYRINNNNGQGTVLPIYEKMVDGTLNPADMGLGKGASEVSESNYKENFVSSNIFSDYSKLFNSGHYFKVMVGFNFELDKSRGTSMYRPGMISPDLPPSINTATGEDKITNGSYNHWATAGFFARANYNYKERYLFEVSARYDGSSRFKDVSKRWSLFPSVSVGWNLANESFMENSRDWLSLLKIRGSYSESGNQNLSSLYPYYQTMPFGGGNGNWLIGDKKPNTSWAPGLNSSSLSWERITSLNLGLEFGFFNNRLSGSFEYFQRRTLDMVGPAPELPNTLGAAVPQANNADLLTSGWELDIQWRDKIGDFGYGARFTLSDSRTKITRYPNPTQSLGTYVVGEYLGNVYGYTTLGIAKTQEEMDAHTAKVNQSAFGSNWGAGDIMYADLDGDGKISNGANRLGDTGDMTILGNQTPHYMMGLTLNFDWKGIDLMLFFQGIGKRDLWLNSPNYWGVNGNEWFTSFYEDHRDFFRTADGPYGKYFGENLDSKFGRPLENNKNKVTQSRFRENGAYLRMKNVQLGYSFPKAWVNKIAMQRLRVYLSGENLWTITSLPKAFDPETAAADQSGKVYPLYGVVSFGVQITF